MSEDIEETGIPPTSQSPPDLSTAISKLMAHPEIIQMAASVLGGDPSSAMNRDTDVADPTPTEPSAEAKPEEGSTAVALPELLRLAEPLLSGKDRGGKKRHGGKGIDRSTALLLALKPYLSESRCKTVDRIVEISKVGELLERLR